MYIVVNVCRVMYMVWLQYKKNVFFKREIACKILHSSFLHYHDTQKEDLRKLIER